MPLSSKKISRLEKEAILRSKDFEYKREQASGLFTDSCQDEESFENSRHRRHDIIRQTHQIQREIDHQVGLIDKLNDRRQQDQYKKQIATTRSFISSLPPPPPSSKSSSLSSSSTSTSSSTVSTRANRASGTTEKYTSKKHTSGSKLN